MANVSPRFVSPDAFHEWLRSGADGQIDWNTPFANAQCAEVCKEFMDAHDAEKVAASLATTPVQKAWGEEARQASIEARQRAGEHLQQALHAITGQHGKRGGGGGGAGGGQNLAPQAHHGGGKGGKGKVKLHVPKQSAGKLLTPPALPGVNAHAYSAAVKEVHFQYQANLQQGMNPAQALAGANQALDQISQGQGSIYNFYLQHQASTQTAAHHVAQAAHQLVRSNPHTAAALQTIHRFTPPAPYPVKNSASVSLVGNNLNSEHSRVDTIGARDIVLSSPRGVAHLAKVGTITHIRVPVSLRASLTPAVAIIKAAESDAKRYTFGVVYKASNVRKGGLQPVLDVHSEFIDGDELQQAQWDYVRKTGENRNIFLQHGMRADIGMTKAGEWVDIVCWPFPVEMAIVNKATGSRQTVTIPANSVYQGVVWEPWAWKEVKSGKIRGYSLGGMAKRQPLEEYISS